MLGTTLCHWMKKAGIIKALKDGSIQQEIKEVLLKRETDLATRKKRMR